MVFIKLFRACVHNIFNFYASPVISQSCINYYYSFLDLEERLLDVIKDIKNFFERKDPHVPVGLRDEFRDFRSNCVANLDKAAQAMHSFKAAKSKK